MQHTKKFEVLKVLSREKKPLLSEIAEQVSLISSKKRKKKTKKKTNNITKTQVYRLNLKQIVNHTFIRREKNIRVAVRLPSY